MNDDQNTVCYITDLADLNDLLTDPTKELKDFHIVNQDVLMVSWAYKKDMAIGGYKTHIFAAAMITTFARLYLYSTMEKLQERVYYHDTGVYTDCRLINSLSPLLCFI